jgi:hypothetical protein
MKFLILISLFLFSTLTHAVDFSEYNFEDTELDLEIVKKLLKKDLPDEILLKERLKIEEPLRQNGTIRGHKVGNGFSLPPGGREPILEEVKSCQVLKSDLKLVLLQDQSFKLYAVFTNDKEGINLAEFLNVQSVERTVGLRSYQYLVGTNPLRGEMFQVEWLRPGTGVLRIVFNEKLHHFPLQCTIE